MTVCDLLFISNNFDLYYDYVIQLLSTNKKTFFKTGINGKLYLKTTHSIVFIVLF